MTKRILPTDYYVYLYLREDGSPYYVGKGKKNRAWSKSNRVIKPPQDETRIQVVRDCLTEEQAFDLEVSLIGQYGRKDNGTGVLRNGTNGGEGTSGHIPSIERRKQQSEIMASRVESGEFNYPSDVLKGKKQPKEQVEKRMKSHIGAKRPKETGDKIRQKATGRTQSKEIIIKRILYVTCEHCGSVVDKGNHTRWHGDKCKHRKE